MLPSHVLGTGLAVPDRVVTNDDLSRLMDTSDEWIRARTGIRERRWVHEGETGADLALAASRRAMEAAGVEPGDLDAIVYATSTPDHFAPGNGVFLQRLLGVAPIRVPIREDLRADPKAARSLATSQTILIVGSAPCYPFGVIDPIEELAALAAERGIFCPV